MKNIKKLLKKQGFTLVELIIVIAIIAVLAVAAFMMLTKWLSKSRDSRRLSDLGTIERGLQVGYSDVDDGINMYPTVKDQTGAIGIMSGDEVVGYQGVVDIEVANAASMQKAPLDPSDNNEYTYLVSQNRQKFQLLAMLEDGTEVSIANNVFALDYSNRFPTTKGFDLGIVLQESTNLPIQYASLGITGLDLTSTDQYVAVVKDDDIRSGTGAATAPIIKEEIIIIPENSEESSCTTQPSYSHASFVAGNPTAPSTDWQQESSSNPCYYECLDGYSGIDCTTPPPGNDVLLIHSNTTNGSVSFVDSVGGKTINANGNVSHIEKPFIKKGVVLESGTTDHTYTPTVIKESDGTYKMWYALPGGEGTAIYLATSNDGTMWTKQGVAINVGVDGELDDYMVYFPNVIKDGDTYKMWYSGHSGSYVRIFYATSDNGTTWTKHGLVMDVDPTSQWDNTHAYMPCVIKDGDTYKMWYAGYSTTTGSYKIGYATSSDGISWERYNGNPVIDIGGAGTYYSKFISTPNVIKNDDGSYLMLISGSDGTNFHLGYSTSTDGINWDNKGILIKQTSGTFDTERLSHPSILKDGNIYKLWYGGSDGTSYNIGYAESTDLKFGSSVMSFDGTSDYLTLTDNEDWNFGDGDFTIDMWVNISETQTNALPRLFEHKSGFTDIQSLMISNGKLAYRVVSGGNTEIAISSSELPKNQWVHIALVRENDTWRLFVGGKIQATVTKSLTLGNYTEDVFIGGVSYDNRDFNGYIDEIRIRKGGAVRTEDFTPPTSVY